MTLLSSFPFASGAFLARTLHAGAAVLLVLLSACGGGGGSEKPGAGTATLTINRSVAEGGTVVSSPAGIDCGATCSTTLSAGTRVTLTATPATGYDFSGWSGSSSVNCAGTGPCTFTLDSAQTVTATFTRQSAVQRALHVVVAGSGSVLSSPAGITGCTSDCTANFATGTAVTLTATPASGQALTGWSGGGCTGTGATCTVTLSADTTVTATFAPVTTPQTLSVTLAGSGTVSSAPAGIACGSTCSATFAQDSTVTLTASPLAGFAFSGWSGACTGTGACTVTMSAARAVTATFAAIPPTTYALNVALSGTGSGAVSSSPAGITCGTTCSTTYTAGTSVTLTAAAATGSTFTGWSGACSGTATTCTVPMNAAATVGAAFTRNTAVLTVTKTGSGTVSSSPTGIACGATCSATYDQGTAVTLTAAAATGYSFSGWAGGCTGTATTCTVTLNAATTVSATFTQITRTVTVNTTTGGAVSSSPAGISCTNGASCSAAFAQGTSVVLAAAPMSGYTFSGWSGACTGTGACTLTLNNNRTVTATFAVIPPVTYSLNVVAATGGTVTSTPTGIACGATCTATYNAGTAVTLTATPQTGYTFSGWSGGGCTGTGACAVTINANTTIAAAFTAVNQTLTVSKAGTGAGTVTSSPAGVSCGSTCAANFLQGTSVTLTAAATTGSNFTAWSGACTGSAATCTVSMSAARSVTATFTLADTTPPTVASTVPVAGAAGVATGAAVTATFSEALNCSTVTASSFTVAGPTGAVAGTVSCSGSTATFTPSAAYASATVYTATLASTIKDVAGNAMAAAHAWTFTSKDTTPAQFTFMAYGDSRAGNGCDGNAVHKSLVSRMVAEPASFVFNLGDMVVGYDRSTNWIQRGDCPNDASPGSLKELIAPLQGKTPAAGLPTFYFPVVGNHDDNWNDGWYPDSFGNGFCDVFDPSKLVPNHTQQSYFLDKTGRVPRYTDPQFRSLSCSTSDSSVYPTYMYYSFDYKNAHFVVLRLNSDYFNLEECFSGCSDTGNYDAWYNKHQLDWLKADLAAASVNPDIQHTFVFLHAPMFTGSWGHAANVSWPTLSKVFSTYKVRVVFSGHNHVYERSHPILASTANPNGVRDDTNGTVYTVTGGGGSALHGFNTPHPLMAKSETEYHYLRIDVNGSAISVKAIKPDGTLLDSYAR